MQTQLALPEWTLRTNRTWIQKLFIVLGTSCLIALLSRISIPLPFSPVPLALGPHACLFVGALLGSRLGAWSVLLYLFQGAIGLPVFALGQGGLAVLMGPRGGYLIGYLIAAWLTGYLIEKSGAKTFRQTFSAMAIGNLVIYLCGLSQLSLFVGVEKAFYLGVFPFLIGDFLKLTAASNLLKKLSSRS